MNIIRNLFFVCILSLGLLSCAKDDTPSTIQPEETGPLQLITPRYFGDYQLPADNSLTKEGVALGRMLFYEKMLSTNNTLSCASCHQQSKAFTDGQAFSKGAEGLLGKRSTMSLVNLVWNKRFFWDGRATSLEEQALVPIQDPLEMHQTLDAAVAKLQNSPVYPARFKQVFGSEIVSAQNIAKALAQFERTLVSSNSRYDQYLSKQYQPTAQELNGETLFMTHPQAGKIRGGNCGDCHGGFLTTLGNFHNNGLDTQVKDNGLEGVTGKTADRGKFRAPSLRNIALTAPYMHDGRFQTLEEVLDHYNDHIQVSETIDPLILEASNEQVVPGEPVKLHLSEQEKKDIITFLHMLTDSTFISDPRFSDPFLNQK
ncbi:cytochrome c peroxidase [Rhodocytophaga aerolata]|uniref:Cytochrome c peroxidase n=1 Tax=Rhodocytophaga aerolata TaxID=455078 RepID=A0ABT8R2L6_9BACT|nr:cytochrome c peroxidase [Rhodocytophaga aerolata]MDO1446345.1 cytochrome c peroxidase [Rhodocytophaga aerolata]